MSVDLAVLFNAMTPEQAALLDDEQLAQLSLNPNPEGGWTTGGLVRPGLSAESLDVVIAWADRVVRRLLDSADPEGDGWEPSEYVAGGWFLRCQ